MNILKRIRIRYKIHKLISGMYECMTEEDLYEEAAFLGQAYRILPEHKKEAFLDELQKVINNARSV